MNWANNPNVKFKGGGNFMGKQKNKNYQNPGNQNEKSILSNDDIDKILNLSPENINILIEKADLLAQKFEQVPASKLRDFYDYVVHIEESGGNNWYLKLMLLKPKMAYQASKETDKRKKPALGRLELEFSNILDNINKDESKFKNFKVFFEAVVAYHKKYAKSN
jgi:CRISPR-associated protein Csm2